METVLEVFDVFHEFKYSRQRKEENKGHSRHHIIRSEIFVLKSGKVNWTYLAMNEWLFSVNKSASTNCKKIILA